MAAEGEDDVLRTCIEQLQRPIEDVGTLLRALCPPLEALNVLPTKLEQYVNARIRPTSQVTARQISRIQSAVLQHHLPVWEAELKKRHLSSALDNWLCPERSGGGKGASTIAVESYTSLASSPITESTLRRLSRLVAAYPVEVIHCVICDHDHTSNDPRVQQRWEDAVRVLVGIPAKVANAAATLELDIPPSLQYGPYLNRLCIGLEVLVHDHCCRRSKAAASSISSLLSKLSRLGLFPSFAPSLPSEVSYFHSVLSTIRTRLATDVAHDYVKFWSQLLLGLGSTITVQNLFTSLLGHLASVSPVLDATVVTRRAVQREAFLLRKMTGDGDPELLETLYSVSLTKDWNEGHARIMVCCLSHPNDDGTPNDDDLHMFLEQVTGVWTSPTHIKHSLFSKHRYLTSLLLLTLSSLHSLARVQQFAMDSDFISSIGHYLGAPDQAIRRCGMLAAEVVASKTGRKLDFGEWEVEGPGKQWSRELRHLIQARDAEAIANLEPAEPKASSNNPIPIPVAVDFADSDDEATPPRKDRPPPPDHAYDSDDSLTGYASSFSSRSPSPTRSELDEIEKDPSLNVGVKKIARPVYLAQLGELLRPTTILKGDDTDEADRIDMGLRCAEELIRRKRDYGSELAENTVNLVHALLALNNNFELDEFDEHRQAALTALVACCPERAAPSVAEEFFRNQYSMDQRFVILKALVFGSRELAGLSVPPSTVDAGRIAFPSKRLPPVMERKYITAADHVTANMPAHGLLEGISRDLIANTAESSGPEPPQLARERQLRIRQPAKVTPLPPPAATTSFFRPQAPVQKPHMTFAVVAAEYFIHPLISRFWTFLRDEQTREARTSAMPTRHQYRGAGTGLILGPTVLGQFVATLGVLIHAARHSPAWGAVLAPDALELALTLGGRRVSMLETEEDEKEGSDAADGQGTHAEVMIAALELALVVLDGSLEFDGGRALGLEHTAVLLGIGEWATKVFNSLDKGERVKGGGGAHEVRLLRAVTGVCLKVDKVSKRWGRSMIQM